MENFSYLAAHQLHKGSWWQQKRVLTKPASYKEKGKQLVAIPPHLLTRCCYTTLLSMHQHETLTYLCSKLPCLFQPCFGGELVSERRPIWQAELNPGYQAAGHAPRSVSTYRQPLLGLQLGSSHVGGTVILLRAVSMVYEFGSCLRITMHLLCIFIRIQNPPIFREDAYIDMQNLVNTWKKYKPHKILCSLTQAGLANNYSQLAKAQHFCLRSIISTAPSQLHAQLHNWACTMHLGMVRTQSPYPAPYPAHCAWHSNQGSDRKSSSLLNMQEKEVSTTIRNV